MRNLNSIFKKASGSATNLFKKASDVGENIFKKTSSVVDRVQDQAPKIAEQISKGSGQAENVLNRVSKISGKIAENPITKGLPFGNALAAGASGLSQAAKYAGQGAGQISSASNLKNYKNVKGPNRALENADDIQKRTKEIIESGKQLGRVFV